MDPPCHSFHEPMFGAGAVTFCIGPAHGSINDINPRLVNFYRTIKESHDRLIKFNLEAEHKNTKEYYYEARKRYNLPLNGGELDRIEEASLLLYLNRTCYNGLYRVNTKGEFNVPFGGYKDPNYVQADRITEAHEILKNLDIFNEDFHYITTVAKEGDLVYFDPPYHPVSPTSAFTAYSSDGFGWDEQQELAEVMAELHEGGVRVVLSNSATEEMRDLYSRLEGFTFEVVDARRAINCDGTKRGKVGELIVSNVEKQQATINIRPRGGKGRSAREGEKTGGIRSKAQTQGVLF